MMEMLELILLLLGLATLIGGAVVVLSLVNLAKTAATKDEVMDLEGRLESKIDEERAVARVALDRVHTRLDSQSDAIGELIGTSKEIGNNVKILLDRAIK